MQLDSHRHYRRLSLLPVTSPSSTSVMPCRRFRCSRSTADDEEMAGSCTLPAPTSAAGVEEWWQIRRKNLRGMRRQTRMILFLMAAMEATRLSPVQLVYAGKHGFPAPGPEDYGLAYSVSYFLSWIYVCAFIVVWVPLFSWWVPQSDASDQKDSKVEKVSSFLKRLNLILLPVAIGLSMVHHAYLTLHTFLYVDSRAKDSRKLPKNTRKNWTARLMLAAGVSWSVVFGNFALQVLEDWELARVKRTEYYVIIVPILVNFGVFFGTVAQYKMEKRIARRNAARFASAARVEVSDTKAVEVAEDQEKQALLAEA